MRTLLSLALLVAAGQSVAADSRLLAAAAHDQVPRTLATLPAPTTPSEKQPLQFSWAISPDSELSLGEPFVAESREYWQTVDGADLQRGVGIRTTAPGALIRISPVADAAQVDPASVKVNAAGSPVKLVQRTTAEQLNKAGLAAATGSVAVQMSGEAAAGQYDVQLPKAQGRYVMHVFEPHSDVKLLASLADDRVLAGSHSQVTVRLQQGEKQATHLQAEAMLVSPSGRSWPVKLAADASGTLSGPVDIPADAPSERGLWEVQVFAADGTVQRDVRTSIAVAQPTAKLTGAYRFDEPRMSFALPVQAGSPGRYELRGTLYATAPDRSLRPVSVAHSAQWLNAGSRAILLTFDRAHLPQGYGAPFELRDLELNDQSRLAPLEKRERAARVER